MSERATRYTVLLCFLVLTLLPATNALAQEQEYPAMDGVSSAPVAFDFRIGDPEVALGHLELIHAMLEDPNMRPDGEAPDIAIVFVGPSVKLVTSDEGGASSEEAGRISEKISAMDADGVHFEVCMTSAQSHDISADSILPEIVQVENGWVSLIGYQHQGYAMIADF